MKPQPILDQSARFCCAHQHHSGVILALYVDEDGNMAGVTLLESKVDLGEIFGMADYSEFDAAIDRAMAKQSREHAESVAHDRWMDRQEVMAGY